MSISTAAIKELRELTGAGVLDCKKALQETEGDIERAVAILRKKGLAAAAKKSEREAAEGLVSAQVSQDGQTGAMIEVNCETDFVARTEDFQELVAALTRQVEQQPDLYNAEALLAAPYINQTDKTVQEVLTETIARLGENMIVRRVARFARQSDSLLDSYVHLGGRIGVLIEVSGGSDEQFAQLVHDLALHIAASAPLYMTEADIPAEVLTAQKNKYQAQLIETNKPEHIKERIVEGRLRKWFEEVVLYQQPFIKEPDLSIEQLLQQPEYPVNILRYARFELGED